MKIFSGALTYMYGQKRANISYIFHQIVAEKTEVAIRFGIMSSDNLCCKDIFKNVNIYHIFYIYFFNIF